MIIAFSSFAILLFTLSMAGVMLLVQLESQSLGEWAVYEWYPLSVESRSILAVTRGDSLL